MNHATLDDFEEVYSYYQKYKVWFPYIRTDKLKRVIEEGRCIYEDKVVLTYNIYKRRTRVSYNSKVYAEKGEGIIHQLISNERGKGHATKVFEEFFKMIDTNLYPLELPIIRLSVSIIRWECDKLEKPLGVTIL